MKKNRITFTLITAVVLLMSAFCFSSSAAGFEYTENETRKIVDGVVYDKIEYNGGVHYTVRALSTSYAKAQKVTDVTVLSEIDGYPVTSIILDTFYNDPDYVDYPNIKEFTIPEGITCIRLEGLSNLEELTIPESVTSLEPQAFRRLGKISKLVIPKGVTEIPDSAFSFCKSLKKVEFKGEITEIGSHAFYYCENLQKISLPASVTRIPDGAFFRCAKLKEVSHESDITYIGDDAFYGCKKLREFDISKAEYIGCDAFSGCLRLKEVVFSDEKTVELGCRAFKETNIEEIMIPDNVVELNCDCGDFSTSYSSCFENCRLLEKVVFEDRKDKTFAIGSKDFSGCVSLETVILPESVEKVTIGESAFSGCKYLESIDISKATVIGSRAFKNCERLTGVITLPDLTFMGCQAFYETDIEEVTLSAVVRYLCTCDEDEGDVYRFGGHQFARCENLKSVTFLDVDTEGTYTKKITIPENMFYFCENLKSVTFPTNAEKVVLGNKVFAYCYDLKTVNNTECIRQYGDYAFFETDIQKVVFSKNKVTIGKFAFSGCTNLKTLKNTESISSIDEKAFMHCSSLKKITFSDRYKVTIGPRAFLECTKLTKVNGSENIKTIGEAAFAYCESLKTFTLGTNLKSVGEKAFLGCKKLSKVTLEHTKTAPTFARKAFYSTADGIKFVAKNTAIAKAVKTNLKNTGVKNAKVYANTTKIA